MTWHENVTCLTKYSELSLSLSIFSSKIKFLSAICVHYSSNSQHYVCLIKSLSSFFFLYTNTWALLYMLVLFLLFFSSSTAGLLFWWLDFALFQDYELKRFLILGQAITKFKTYDLSFDPNTKNFWHNKHKFS